MHLRGLLMAMLVSSLSGCGWFGGSEEAPPPSSTTPMTRADYRTDMNEYMARIKTGTEKSIGEKLQPIMDKMATKEELALMEERLKENTADEGGKTRADLHEYSKAMAGYHKDVKERLTQHDGKFKEIQDRLANAVAAPGSSGGGSAAPGGAGIGHIETVATVGGVKVTYKGPATLSEADRIIKAQQKKRQEEAREIDQRWERAQLLRALENKQSGTDRRITSLEDDLREALPQLKKLDGNVSRLGQKVDGVLDIVAKLAKQRNMHCRYCPPSPLPPESARIYYDGWWIYENRVNNTVYTWCG